MITIGRKKIAMLILCSLLGFVTYTIWDNHRFVVVEQEIKVNGIQDSFKDFTILQITDLHEQLFGENQQQLIQAINGIDYDVLVFTGDMLDSIRSKNDSAFYTIIDGLDNKENILYVPGNTDPLSYQVDSTVETSEFINGLKKRNVTFLESLYTIDKGESAIHFVNFELSIIKNERALGNVQGVVQPPYAQNPAYLSYQQQLIKDLKVLEDMDTSDLLIAVNHYPIVDKRIETIKASPDLIWRKYDLIIAGHYHGGQIRLPILGPIFVPEPWYEPNRFFPPADRIKGLWEYQGTKQYVSAGLGSSDAVSFLNFRLFNSPEINVLKLTTKQ
ncbi:metallophosphoesterase [Virgibacillus sp. AGTR]|uniref:metallophosphoesterase n=1 Tax=unclassified Virgibacillus TaxID=2620237 RepID=UPI000EF46BE8|nr:MULTISPECIES: metallophosphoesterase [unclassified Virgibacillus]MCC2251751.1 metallophosphoesterase [Virgibacillus sp. AGTR]MDY7044703.1 metallophosphoesterase [Virgibacillus sp. M23]QRZ18944.1 metallophosphoesterase [Virgibacillus sp. AGTR]